MWEANDTLNHLKSLMLLVTVDSTKSSWSHRGGEAQIRGAKLFGE